MRRLMPERMSVLPESWPLLPDVCGCDIDLCGYLDERKVRGASIFHFGSGGHHLLGRHNHDRRLDNEIWAITISPPEHKRYLHDILRSRSLGRHYRVLFGDIYDLSAAALPAFDLVTLFHLCEFTPSDGRRRRLDDAGLLELFRSKLTVGGRMLFYEGSVGYGRAAPLIGRAVAERRLTLDERYQNLIVYRT